MFTDARAHEIARQIVRAMLEAGVKVVFVTHMFDLARSRHDMGRDTDLFLRAERGSGGTRTFRMVDGEPLPTSHGEDLYRRIFGTAPRSEERRYVPDETADRGLATMN